MLKLLRGIRALAPAQAAALGARRGKRHVASFSVLVKEIPIRQPVARSAVAVAAAAAGTGVTAVVLTALAPRHALCDAHALKPEHTLRASDVEAVERIKADAFRTYEEPGWRRVLRMLWRVIELSLLYAPLGVGIPLALTLGQLIPAIEDACWRYALSAVHRAGPAYIKLAQWASSRSDLFPSRFCVTFEQLHDNVPPHSWKETEAILAREVGPQWQAELRLETDVVGSGCIAQVYRGTIHSPDMGSDVAVAVKVIHPGVEDLVAVDIDILRTVARALTRVPALKWLSLPDVVEDFALQMFWQLDLRKEGHNLARLKHNFKDDQRIVIPTPFLDRCSRDLLIETFEPGVPISSFIESPKCDAAAKRELSRLGMNSMAKMIFIDNFVHCDLHPGNILISGDTGSLRMTFLDAGIVKAFLNWDGREAGELMVATAAEQMCADVEGFCQGIQQIIDDSKHMPFFQNFAEYTTRIFDLACRHKVKLEGNFITIALAMKICEGLSIRLDPNIEMVKGCIPWLFKAQLHHGVSISQYLWDSHGVSVKMLKNLSV